MLSIAMGRKYYQEPLRGLRKPPGGSRNVGLINGLESSFSSNVLAYPAPISISSMKEPFRLFLLVTLDYVSTR